MEADRIEEKTIIPARPIEIVQVHPAVDKIKAINKGKVVAGSGEEPNHVRFIERAFRYLGLPSRDSDTEFIRVMVANLFSLLGFLVRSALEGTILYSSFMIVFLQANISSKDH